MFVVALFTSHISAQCSITIKNYQGKLIAEENYTLNTQAFKIYPSEECTNLTVNESEYNITYGIYKVGTYNITALPDAQVLVKIVEVPEDKRNYYYLIAHAGSFPIMYSTFSVIFDRNEEDNIHISIGRSFQFDYDELQKKYKNMVFSSDTNSSNIYEFVKETIQVDPYSYFVVNVDDMRVHLALKWIINQGIPTNRYRINLITDGTSSYNYFYRWGLNTSVKLQQEFDNFKTIYENHAAGLPSNLGLLIHGGDIIFSMYPAASYENFYMYQTHPQMFESSEENATKLIQQIHFEKINIFDIIYRQPADKKEYMYKLCQFNTTEFEKEYFQEGKRLVMILGHGPSVYYPNTPAFESSYVNQSLVNFPAYSFFFKPHPANVPTGEFADWLNQSGVKLFTKRMNAEIIFSAFRDRMLLGGYQTTTYLTASEKDIAFFYAFKSITEFAAPWPQFYEKGVYRNVVVFPYDENYIPEQYRTKPTSTPVPATAQAPAIDNAENPPSSIHVSDQKEPTKSTFQKVGLPIIGIIAAIAVQAIIVAVIVVIVLKKINSPSTNNDTENNLAYP